MPSPEWKLQRIGLSSDYRTNRWSVTPACGHNPFEPPTTMFSTQWVQCHCGREAFVNYNELTIVDMK